MSCHSLQTGADNSAFAVVATALDTFECGDSCKCKNLCGNRIVQNFKSHNSNIGLRLYKDEEMGWGVECMKGAPAGTYIDVYRVSSGRHISQLHSLLDID
jgi:hypothetical protein